MHGWMCGCTPVRACVCVRACMRASVCVRVCLCVSVCVSVCHIFSAKFDPAVLLCKALHCFVQRSEFWFALEAPA